MRPELEQHMQHRVIFMLAVFIVLGCDPSRAAVPVDEILSQLDKNRRLPAFTMNVITTETLVESSFRDPTNVSFKWVQTLNDDGLRKDILSQAFSGSESNRELVQSFRVIWNGSESLSRGLIIGSPGVSIPKKKQLMVNYSKEPPGDILDTVATGSRVFGMHLGGVFDVVQALEDSDSINLEPIEEVVDGATCYVLTAKTPSGSVRAWVDAESFLFRRWIVTAREGDLYYGNRLPWRLAAPGLDRDFTFVSAVHELSNVEIEQIEGRWIHTKGMAKRTEIYANGEREVTVTTTERSNVDFDPDFEALGAFIMDGIPDGTRVSAFGPLEGLKYEWRDGQPRLVTPDDAIRDIEHMVSHQPIAGGSEISGPQKSSGGLAGRHSDSGSDAIRWVAILSGLLIFVVFALAIYRRSRLRE